MEKPLSYQARREVLQQAAPQYREASSSQKRTQLDAFVSTTGNHRTYARWLLNHAEVVQQTHVRSQLRKCGPEVQHALFLAWHAANRICAKRLIPFLPTLIEALERHEHLHHTGGNAAQAADSDPNIRGVEGDPTRLSRSGTGALIVEQTSRAATCTRLSLTDVATGWTECLPLLYRSQEAVLAALRRARTLFPFPILGIDTDNGGQAHQ